MYFMFITIQIMINVLARILCMHSQVKHVSTTREQKPPAPTNGGAEKQRYPPFVYEQVGYEMQKEDKWKFFSNGPHGQGSVTGSETESSNYSGSPMKAIENLESEVREIKRHVVAMACRISERESKDYIGKEWKVVALVLDRIFFFIYLGCIIVSVFTIFPRANNTAV